MTCATAQIGVATIAIRRALRVYEKLARGIEVVFPESRDRTANRDALASLIEASVVKEPLIILPTVPAPAVAQG
jgi:hypothetical protein